MVKVIPTGCMRCGIPPIKRSCKDCECEPYSVECLKLYKVNRMHTFTYNGW